MNFIDFKNNNTSIYSNRSWLTAGILQLFLGAFGIGRFYLGYKKIAMLQIATSILTIGFGGFVWGLIDGVMILAGREKYDSKGRLLI